ncbi:MAG TPA: hypothetical protein PLL30_09615 [Candidatus Krumholzibacteria bacterium]|nr:hypothetical protein [Candidatus Krumholzibacteria bacterium]HPD72020.1 hypothetical protein [Candidatus Krumholzibacteria bacterium]HRY41047.1 hypothetical protein [Candidatus Krumholzibacteria bacterium]
MRKPYTKPVLSCENVQLGVFGNYGEDDNGPTTDITPIKVIDRFQRRLD